MVSGAAGERLEVSRHRKAMSESRKIYKPDSLPDQERPLGRFMADAHGVAFRPPASLAEAKTREDYFKRWKQ